jgi:DNA-binding NarL/FixJ family response regulator
MTTILLADDHPPTRAGVRSALEATGFDVVADVPDAASAVDAAVALRPDVALLDVHMPGSGIWAAREITARLPDTAIVMLTISRNDDDLFDALRAGASGYLLKDMNPGRLGAALEGVLAGEAALPRSLTARVIEEFRGRGKRRLPFTGDRGVALTSREWEVLDLMQDGLSTAEIAERLFVSRVTVRRHVSGILRKLQVGSREEALKQLAEARSGN